MLILEGLCYSYYNKTGGKGHCCLASQCQEIVTLTFMTKGFESSYAPITRVINKYYYGKKVDFFSR